MAVVLGAAGAGVLLYAWRQSGPISPGAVKQALICTGSPPTPFPSMPDGWQLHAGKVSKTAATSAALALKSGIGSFSSFLDEDGETRGLTVTWHCHEPNGWHKGVTLLDRKPT